MYQTTYHRPSSVDEAVAMFAKGSDAKYLAGGHTLIPVMKQRLAAPTDVIDLGKIDSLGLCRFPRVLRQVRGLEPLLQMLECSEQLIERRHEPCSGLVGPCPRLGDLARFVAHGVAFRF